MVRALLPLALLGSGFAAGGLMISVLGGAPLLLRLPTEDYIPVHQFLVTRFDPFMPISMCTALAADAVLVFMVDDPTGRNLLGFGALLLVVAMVVSMTRNVPINRWIRTVDPNHLPEDWERLDPRIRWRNWNLARTVCVVIALLANVSAVASLL
jgi:uncharacterized membrane protein